MKVCIPSLPFSSSLNPLQPTGRSSAGVIQTDSCALKKRLNLGLEANARVKVLAVRVASEGVLSQECLLIYCQNKSPVCQMYFSDQAASESKTKLIPCEWFGSWSTVLTKQRY